MALSIGFRVSVSLHPAIQATGRLALAPAELAPASRTCLSLDTRSPRPPAAWHLSWDGWRESSRMPRRAPAWRRRIQCRLRASAPMFKCELSDLRRTSCHGGRSRISSTIAAALSANMSETVTPWEFRVEGEAGSESDERIGAGPRWAGDRGSGEGDAAAVHARVQAKDRPGGGQL